MRGPKNLPRDRWLFRGLKRGQKPHGFAIELVKRISSAGHGQVEVSRKDGLIYSLDIPLITGHPLAQPFLCAPDSLRILGGLEVYGQPSTAPERFGGSEKPCFKLPFRQYHRQR